MIIFKALITKLQNQKFKNTTTPIFNVISNFKISLNSTEALAESFY